MITTDTHVFFYGGVHYSNWHVTRGQFHDPVLDRTYDHSEGGFMAHKARFFGDLESFELMGGSPPTVKRAGREIRGYNDEAWNAVRLGFMEWVLLCKYRSNPEWAAELKATGNRILIEASPTDRVWGIGMDVEAAAAFAPPGARDEIQWPGRNLLGKALMTVRGLL